MGIEGVGPLQRLNAYVLVRDTQQRRQVAEPPSAIIPPRQQD